MVAKKPSITNRIRELRFHHGELTQQQLADKVGVTRQTVIALEAEKYVPSLLLALRIAAVFGATVEEVFSLAGNGKPSASRRS